jgi:hypothetical protein
MVTLAWMMGKPLGLLFDPFESVVSQIKKTMLPVLSPAFLYIGSLHLRYVIGYVVSL